MFPCSSTHQNLKGHKNNSTTFQIDHHYYGQNPITISPNHDKYYHHHHQHQNSSPHNSHSTIPSIFEDDGVILSHLLSQQQVLSSNMVGYSQGALLDEISAISVTNALPEVADHDDHHKLKTEKPVPRKRTTGRKDRHSKISTAQGLRDRRMRLSLQVARRFFDLQDMLGFDKASRTIEWLFAKSKSAIKELKNSFAVRSANSTPESEVVARAMGSIGPEDDDEECQFGKKKLRKFQKVVAKENRDKARERARERTKEKMLEKTRQASRSIDTSLTISEAENRSSELKGEEEITCHFDLKMADSRFDQFGLDYSSVHHGTNFEEDCLGFCESWDFITGTASKARSPSSLFMSKTTSSNAQNPSSVLMGIKNPNPIYSMASSGALEIGHGEHSSSDLLAGDMFCSLNF